MTQPRATEPDASTLSTTTKPNGEQPLIQLEGIKKVFYTDEVETHALSDVHFTVRPGEYVAISGPSGCGKTTLLSILGLLDTPSDGEYNLGGEPVAGLSAAERARIRNRQIGFIFQAFNLIGDLTVEENVELPLAYRGMPSAERKKRVHGTTLPSSPVDNSSVWLLRAPLPVALKCCWPTSRPAISTPRWRGA